MKKNTIILLLILSLSVLSVGQASQNTLTLEAESALSTDLVGVSDVVSYNYEDYLEVSYTPVPSFIAATGSTAFDAINATWNFPGNGSASNPFIISGYNFTTGFGEALDLRSMTYYIVIENNLFWFTDQFDESIYLDNADNILIRNNVFVGGYDAVEIYYSDNVNITDNFMGGNDRGIYNYYGNMGSIVNNVIVDSNYEGIYVYGTGSFSVIVEHNHVLANNQNYYYSSYSAIAVWYFGHAEVNLNSVIGGYTGIIVYLSGSGAPSSVNYNDVRGSTYYGLQFGYFENGFIIGNTVDMSTTDKAAIYFSYSGNNTVTDNTLLGGGLQFGISFSTDHIIQNSTTGTIVNGLPIYFGINLPTVTLDAANYGQVIVVGVQDVSISNMVFDHVSVGIAVYMSGFVTLTNNQFTNMGEYAIDVNNAINSTTISDNVIMGAEGGMRIVDSNLVSISNNKVVNTGYNAAIMIEYSSNVTLDHNWLSYGDTGIRMYEVIDFTIMWNYLYSYYYTALELDYVESGMICDNMIQGALYGIDIYQSVDIEIEANVVSMTAYGALRVEEASNLEIFDNIFVGEGGSSDYVTVGLYGASEVDFTDNSITSQNKGLALIFIPLDYIVSSGGGCCSEGGIVLDAYDDFSNNFANNDFYAANAISSIVYSKGDHASFQSNFYSNYDGSGSYAIAGSSMVDSSPSSVPQVVVPNVEVTPVESSYEYTVDSIENVIQWTVSSIWDVHYALYEGDTLIENGHTDGDISVNVDGKAIGVYSYTLLLLDYYGSEIVSTIIVNVVSGDGDGTVTETQTHTVTVTSDGPTDTTVDTTGGNTTQNSIDLDTPVPIFPTLVAISSLGLVLRTVRRKEN